MEIGYREFAVFALPGKPLAISADAAGSFQVSAPAGTWQATGANRWTWTAPAKPGVFPLEVVRADGARLELEAFVMVPASREHNGRLNGYLIGQYPRQALHGLPAYVPPSGFVELTQATAGIHVSPHFTLGQFQCKEAGAYPKYLVLTPRLLLKLEGLVQYLNTRGIAPEAIHVMSGYRTPWYNRQLGDTHYSRHMWGDAADIYIDSARGGYLDSRELSGDLAQLFREPAYADLRGGLGTYPATAAHAPFVHVDARGFSARW